MTVYFDDDRSYTPVIEQWVRNFIATMNEGVLRAGDDSGDSPFGVKIIFDGYGYDYENDREDSDTNTLSFAVFVHKNSLTEEFPEHEQTPWALIHRPKEEVCIWAWYDVNADLVDIIPFEDNNSTELNPQFVTDLIFKIHQRDQ